MVGCGFLKSGFCRPVLQGFESHGAPLLTSEKSDVYDILPEDIEEPIHVLVGVVDVGRDTDRIAAGALRGGDTHAWW